MSKGQGEQEPIDSGVIEAQVSAGSRVMGVTTR